jgi:predicted nucleic acid-binding Zn ribbon protein
MDVNEGMNAGIDHKCDKCNRGMYRKISKCVGIVFNGSGFYCNDN